MNKNILNLTDKNIITELDIWSVPNKGEILLDVEARLTPLALDFIKYHELVILRKKKSGQRIKIALGSDHGGFLIKEKLKSKLNTIGIELHDCGTFDERPVDYPDIAHTVASLVSQKTFSLGILLDGAGIGSAMVANKVPGIRAAMCYDTATARNSREHNDANILTLGAKMISEERIFDIVEVWLNSDISEERHIQRVQKIQQIESLYLH